MDAVILYVDCNKQGWRSQWNAKIGGNFDQHRFRDWGLLRFVLRGIDNFMPFIDNVFLVVSDKKQVPEWAGGQVKVITHRQIVPERFLPTFNSNVIEQWIWRIPGLSREFIYFNDDTVPVIRMREDDFFGIDGEPKIRMTRNAGTPKNEYQGYNKNSSDWARKALGLAPVNYWVTPQHTALPLRRDLCEELMSFEPLNDYLRVASTPLRDWINVNQYIFSDYAFFKGIYIDSPLSYRYNCICRENIDDIIENIQQPQKKVHCLNDGCDRNDFEELKDRINQAFTERMPYKCRFEK